jgi:ABC-type Fe3+-hydroxamate transport system substrate-binding protein
VRVVSLVPSWTETLCAFGLAGALVGITRYCVHPREVVAHVEKVGGTKDPDVARIAALRPDLVVCDHEEQRREDVEALRAAGLRVWVSDVRSVDDSLREIASLGRAAGREAEAAALVARIGKTLDAMPPREPVPVYCPIWRRPWMTPTRDTYTHHVLAAAGARNVFAHEDGRYPERTPAQAREAGAQVALLPTEPYPFHEKLDAARAELVEAGFAAERIGLVDGEALTWYGAREPEGLVAVARAVREATGAASSW